LNIPYIGIRRKATLPEIFIYSRT